MWYPSKKRKTRPTHTNTPWPSVKLVTDNGPHWPRLINNCPTGNLIWKKKHLILPCIRLVSTNLGPVLHLQVRWVEWMHGEWQTWEEFTLCWCALRISVATVRMADHHGSRNSVSYEVSARTAECVVLLLKHGGQVNHGGWVMGLWRVERKEQVRAG